MSKRPMLDSFSTSAASRTGVTTMPMLAAPEESIFYTSAFDSDSDSDSASEHSGDSDTMYNPDERARSMLIDRLISKQSNKVKEMQNSKNQARAIFGDGLEDSEYDDTDDTSVADEESDGEADEEIDGEGDDSGHATVSIGIESAPVHDPFPKDAVGGNASNACDDEVEAASDFAKCTASLAGNLDLGTEDREAVEEGETDDHHTVTNFEDELRIFETKASNVIVPEPSLLPDRSRKTFHDLEQLKYELLLPKSENFTAERTCCTEHQLQGHIYLLDDEEDDARCSTASLRKAKKKIKQDLKAEKARLETIKNKQAPGRQEFIWHLGAAGIPLELFSAYVLFCDSLDPEFQRCRFTITCDSDHQQNYTRYDPSFELFKQQVKMPYTKRNFRCEASVSEMKRRVDGERQIVKTEYIVEFSPLRPLEPLNFTAKTWGEQYPELYDLATAASQAGSSAAIEMLAALPDRNASFAGGWLFDYVREDALKHQRVLSDRWRFRSAHNIDAPMKADEKKKQLDLIFRPKNPSRTDVAGMQSEGTARSG